MPYLLEVRVPDAFGLIVGVADIVPNLGRLAAELTYSAHDSQFLSADISSWFNSPRTVKSLLIPERAPNSKPNPATKLNPE